MSPKLLKRKVAVGTLGDVMARFDTGEGLDSDVLCRTQERLYFLPRWDYPGVSRQIAWKVSKLTSNITETSHHCGCTDYFIENKMMVRYPCSPEHDLHVERPDQTEGRVLAGFLS